MDSFDWGINMKKMFFVLLLLGLQGCATVDTLHQGNGQSFMITGKTYDEVWRAVVRSTSRSLTIVESDKSMGILKAEKAAGVATWGEVVGVFVSPARNGVKNYTIEVQSLKRASFQITGQNWEQTIITGIKAELE